MAPNAHNEEDIYYFAVSLPQAERSAYIKAACGDDRELWERVEALLRIREAEGNLLESPPFMESLSPEAPLSEGPGTVIGRYKLLERIGEGGMAVVYMAEQEEPIRRKVALKIIKVGMDTRQVIARFEAERQALAMMDHPNIAKVFDAGATETGRPYFVMELVQGVSVTEYCDKNNLTTKDRLALFIQVCQAVQHAHQKGIIHRDIKPSNVMVTQRDGVPVPKVIDFGIAKATNQKLTEKTLFTRYAHLIGTPAYMSPEQAELSDLDIDTRTDIYSLGVLLYELLTGNTPFSEEELRKAGYLEMQRVIREQEPAKPSTKLSTLGETLTGIAQHRGCTADLLRRAVQGDLDWIVMKALEKNRTRRYNTASEFAQDIGRHLGDEPVVAGPPSKFYRSRKFVRRHRTAVISCILVATALVTGLVVSTVMYVQARQAREREAAAHAEAKRQAMISQAVNQFLNDDLLASVNPRRTKGHEVTVMEVLDAAAEKLDGKFEDEPSVEAAIRQTLGKTYRSLGRYESAEPHYERVVELYRSLFGAENPDTLESMAQLGFVYADQWRHEEAERLWVKVLECRRRVLGDEDPATLGLMSWIGWLRNRQERFKEAEQLLVKTLEAERRVLGEEHGATLWTMATLAWSYTAQDRYDEAEPLLVKALEGQRRTLGEEDTQILVVMDALANMVYLSQDRYEEAEPLLVEMLEARRRLVGEDHPTTWLAMWNLARMYNKQGRYQEAERQYRQCISIGRKLLEDFPPDGDHIRFFGYALGTLYWILRGTGQTQAAEDVLPEVISHWERLATDHPDKSDDQQYYGSSLSWLGEMLRGKGQLEEAEQIFQKALSANTRAIELEPNNPDYWRERAATYSKMEQWEEALGDYSRAIELDPDNPESWRRRADTYAEMEQWEKALGDHSRAIELDPDNPDSWRGRAGVYRELEQWDKAIADSSKAIELNPGSHWHWSRRADVYRRLEQWDKAVADYTKAIEFNPYNQHYWNLRGRSYLQLDEPSKAVADYTKAIELTRTYAHYWHMRGVCYLRLGEPNKAVADYTKAIEFNPEGERGHYWSQRARAYQQLAQYEKARSDFTKAIELDPDNSDHWHRRGKIHLNMEDWDNALADFTKAIELDPNSSARWYTRANIYADTRQWSEAVADYSKAIELDPNNANAHYRRALAHLGVGDTEGYRSRCAQMLDHFGQTQEAAVAHRVAWTCVLAADAVEDFNRVVELAEFAIEKDGKTDQSLTALGAVLYRAGRPDEAVRRLSGLASEWEQGKELPTQASSAYAWFFLAMAHHHLGHADESQRYFELAAKRANQEVTGTAGWNRELTLQLLQAEAQSLLRVSEKGLFRGMGR